jgi:ATP-dependent helicase/nuclease subunit B
MPPALYTISAELPFLDSFVQGLRARAGDAPLVLANITVLLPTRRAARSLREAFLRAGNGTALLLPKMVPVGDLDPEELAFAPDEAAIAGLDLGLPAAVPALRRELLLIRLVRRYAAANGEDITPGQAAPLARELARFLDEVHAEGCNFEKLDQIVPEQHAEHWQRVLKFLDILRVHWPAILGDLGCLDPAARRNRLLDSQAAAWAKRPPAGPVIAAGLTGGIPAVARLMQTVASLPGGAVVLPGLDRDADGALWEEILIDPGHPQHVMAQFLAGLEIERSAVAPWIESAAPLPRAKLLREALAPAALTHRWRYISGIDAHSLAGLRRLDCAGPQEEAVAIALLLREALQQPGKTAALVTPDRDLARRVAAELRRWSIEIDDSAGVPLNRTPPGVFLRLVLALTVDQWAPLPLLSLLKHPLAACGLPPAGLRERVRALEKLALRGARPKPGAEGLRQVLPPDTPRLHDLVDRLEAALARFATLLAQDEVDLPALVAAHIAACESIAESDEQAGAARLWREAAGEEAALFLNELLLEAKEFPALRGADYPALFEALIAGAVVRPAYGRHPRLFIWGLLEARLQQADLVVLGGLNEGTWPATTATDPWLSRPMRQAFGLPPLEQRIGAAAHDFALAWGAREVVMTRATRVEGTPTVPSRWLLRLDTVLRAAGIEPARLADAAPLDWQAQLDAPAGPPRPIAPPAPCPPLAARPRRLSVTEVETWRRDPYAIYAKHVLRLKPLDPLDQDPGFAERGQIIHDALARFLTAFPQRLPDDAVERLLVLGQQSFSTIADRPGLYAFWWPRYCRIAEWVAQQERARRRGIEAIHGEISGSFTIHAPAGAFELRGRADRIELRRDGKIALIDYKTGSVPRASDIELGFAPQLTLEAAMIEAGGFAEIGKSPIAELAYWRLSGADPAGEIKYCVEDAASLRRLIDDTLAGLERFIAGFDDPATPYRAIPSPERAPRYSDYAHLERAAEWLPQAEPEE